MTEHQSLPRTRWTGRIINENMTVDVSVESDLATVRGRGRSAAHDMLMKDVGIEQQHRETETLRLIPPFL